MDKKGSKIAKVAVAVGICVVVGAAVYLLGHHKHHQVKSAKMPPLEVRVATAKLDSLYDRIRFSTTIDPLYKAIIEPRVEGYLTKIYRSDGEPVVRGQRLFTIEPSAYSSTLLAAEAQQQQAEASLILAKRNYERARPLAEIEAISRMDLDQYKTSYLAAQADLDYAKQQVANSRLNLNYTSINAPISGVIATTEAKEGDYVGPGTSFSLLTTIEYLDTVTLALPIPISRYLNYRQSKSYNNEDLLSDIEITLSNSDVYDSPVEYFYTEQAAANNTSTIAIVVRTPNTDHLLKSGMFARVNANIGSKTPRVVIPQQAVSQMQGVNSVWVVGRDSTVALRTVTLGSTYGDLWEIESGVEPGENLLLSGQLKVHDGSKVSY